MSLLSLLMVAAQTLPVGAGAPYGTIGAALAEARAGDTIRVAAGVYRERIVIDVPVVLIGEGRPTIDGGGEGTVVTLRAPAVLSGFDIRGSGRLLDQEDAGVLITADSCEIRDNHLSDVLFGIYLKESDGSSVIDNTVTGKDRPLGRRGDGIRLWASHDASVEGNVVRRTRDVVIYFSHGLEFRDNLVTDGRYGLHYMYSSDNTFEGNEFARNDVAAFIMYSADITLRNNIFASASGHSGFGVGLKDADRIEMTGNLMVQNQVGLYFDNSPSLTDAHNWIDGNILAFNDVGVSLMPSVRSNLFEANSFVGNVRDVSVSGGGTALSNGWTGNHWDVAAAWDEDGDGRLDAPHRIDRLSDDLFARHPDLRLFELSPAALALDALGRFFPLLEPEPIVVDSAPLVGRDRPLDAKVGLRSTRRTEGRPSGGDGAIAAIGLGLAAFAAWGAWRWSL